MSNATYKQDLHDISLAVATNCKLYCDKRIDDLEWQIGTYNYDVATDSNVARIKTLPSDTYKSQINYIGGKTVKYNQLAYPVNITRAGITYTTVNGVYNLSGTTTETYSATSTVAIDQTHKYFMYIKLLANPNNITFHYGDLNSGLNIELSNLGEYSIINQPYSTGNHGFGIERYGGVGVDFTGVKFLVVIVDLTSVFGSGNEPSDVATAIPLLKANGYKLDGTDTYSTGSLKHAIVSGVKYWGINIWNEQWELGDINSLGVLIPATDRIRSKNYIEILPNTTTLYVEIGTSTLRIVEYDTNYNFVKYADSLIGNTTYNLQANTKYIMFYTNSAYGTTYKNDICINISNASYNGNYYPYVAPITKTIPSEVLADTRYGLGYDNTNYNHLDSDGHLRGKRNSYTFTGNESWVSWGSGYYAIVSDLNAKTIDNSTIPNATLVNAIATTINSINGGSVAYGFSIRANYIYISSEIYNNISSYIGKTLEYDLEEVFDIDYSQYFETNWNKVDLDKQYATCEMVVDEPIDMPNSITNLIKEVKA